MSSASSTQSASAVRDGEATAPAAASATQTGQADASTVRRWLDSGECVLIDVREPDEHARERIAGARLLPLSRFDAAQIAPAGGQRVVLHCKSGSRSKDAARIAEAPGSPLAGVPVLSMTGGIEAWKKANLPVEVDRRVSPLNVMRQVQLVIGIGVLVGTALAWLVHPIFLGIPAFFGAGLTFAGASGTCALAALLSRMPWNRRAGAACSASCAA